MLIWNKQPFFFVFVNKSIVLRLLHNFMIVIDDFAQNVHYITLVKKIIQVIKRNQFQHGVHLNLFSEWRPVIIFCQVLIRSAFVHFLQNLRFFFYKYFKTKYFKSPMLALYPSVFECGVYFKWLEGKLAAAVHWYHSSQAKVENGRPQGLYT